MVVKEKNSQPLPGLEPPIIQPVAQRYTTELSRLHDHWESCRNKTLSKKHPQQLQHRRRNFT
jgi:hypothetical protein